MAKTDFVWTVLRYICFLANVIALIIWGHSSIQHFLEKPTSSSVTLSYGDEGDMLTRFPVITICEKLSPLDYIINKIAWKNQSLCGSADPPLFASYMQDCIKKNKDVGLNELLKNVTYSMDELIRSKDDLRFSGLGGHWYVPMEALKEKRKDMQEPYLYDQYDINHGHCFTIDVSALTKNGTLQIKSLSYPIGMTLHLNLKQDNYRFKGLALFLHNGSRNDISSIDDNSKMVPINPGHTDIKIKTTIIKSLPNRANGCVKKPFMSCAIKEIEKETKDQFNCSLVTFRKHSKYKTCSGEIFVNAIKKMKNAFDDKKYGICKFEKPCHAVIYSITDKEETKVEGDLCYVNIQFENAFVEIIQDSYNYPFLSVFAEIGGVLGMLLGLSFFGIFEFVSEKMQQYLRN